MFDGSPCLLRGLYGLGTRADTVALYARRPASLQLQYGLSAGTAAVSRDNSLRRMKAEKVVLAYSCSRDSP